MTLTEFLLARITEDEAVARDAEGEHFILSDGDYTVPFLEHHSPGRILAECEAKRQVVEVHNIDCYVDEDGGEDFFCAGCAGGDGYRSNPYDVRCPTLAALAAVYADHPDYRAEWKP